jgi:hypothetical protein
MGPHLNLRRLTLPFSVALLTLASCADPSPLLFPPAAALTLASGPATLELPVGELLPGGITVRLLDTRGNPVEGADAVFAVTAGGGQLTVQTGRSDAQGEVRVLGWRMGTAPGENRLEVRVSGVDPVSVAVQARPGRPATIRTFGSFELPAGQVGEPLSAALPLIRVEDRFGNPVPEALVRFSSPQGGQVEPAEARTDAQGELRPTRWILGTQAGEQSLVATVEGAEVNFRSRAAPGPAARTQWTAGEGARAEIGMQIPARFRVTDAFGNGIEGVPVNFEVIGGGGTVTGAQTLTDRDGEAAPLRWNLGGSPGLNRLEATAQGFGPVAVMAEAMGPDWIPVGRHYRVRQTHVNQGTQTFAGSIPLVPGRPGLLRIFVEASEGGAPPPQVSVRLSRNGVPLGVFPATGPLIPSTPTETLETGITPSWNLILPGDLVTPGLEWVVVVDPDDEIPVVTRRWSQFPEAGGLAGAPFQPMPKFRVRFIPLRDTQTGNTGDLTPSNLESYMEMTRRMLPIGEDSIYIGPTFTTNLYDADGRIRSVLSELRAVWLATPHRNEYFHGIFPGSGPLAFSGIAYRPSNPRSPAPIGMSYDRFPGAPFTVAHEFGHNFGVPHAPCGNPAGPDPLFPYFNAELGVTGWDRQTNTLMSPTANRDLMSYCSPRWVSDYNYLRMMNWRIEAPGGAFGDVGGFGGAGDLGTTPSGRAEDGILVWGEIRESGLLLEPILPVQAPPFLPSGDGPLLLEGFGEGGVRLFSYRFTPDEVPHSNDPTEAHFGFVIPLSDALREGLTEVRVTAPGTATARRVRSAPEEGMGATGTRPLGALLWTASGNAVPFGALAPLGMSPGSLDPGRSATGVSDLGRGALVRVTWDPVRFPLLVLQDPETGEIVGMDRSGDVDLRRWAGPVELVLSDGLRAWRAGVPGR